jgi:orotate phosphoribosyltransferase
MNEERIWRILKEANAILRNDHFVYTKGGHGHEYVNKDALMLMPFELDLLCKEIADHFRKAGPAVVLGPAIAGAIISFSVARQLNTPFKPLVSSTYADKEGDGFVLKRGFDAVIAGKHVLVVEDILNTGGSVKQIVELARAHGGNVVGVGAICNRGGVTTEMIANPPELFSVASVSMQMYPADECPFCKEGRPINTKIGKGKEYVEKHGQPKAPEVA